ncbi:SxtJ family membrane protein [uncultured Dokdonia sp.]|uniref:SxtJ family membrane protein n=1 Tax=uncultured Dokdonia sp. TaxID=575653 RepID=UPI002626CA52|nr:SxtJ family membrane protein [uncultured Dokdonia sp.]
MATKKELTPSKTVLTIVVGFLVIYMITKLSWALWVAITIGVLGMLSSFIALKIQDLWMGLSTVLSRIIPPILLSVIFFVILFPVALLSRLFGDKDPLQLKKTDKSLFKTVDKPFSKDTFEKTW